MRPAPPTFSLGRRWELLPGLLSRFLIQLSCLCAIVATSCAAAPSNTDNLAAQVLVRRDLVTKELAATVAKFISENQTHQPGQAAPAPPPPAASPPAPKR